MWMHGKRPDGSADLPPVPEKQPIVIRRGTFMATLYDIVSLLDLPLVNVRELWKIMFGAADENEDTIGAIREWLPKAIDRTKEQQAAYTITLDSERMAAETARRTIAAFGSIATKAQKKAVTEAGKRVRSAAQNLKTATAAHERAKKLQIIFTQMAARARI